MKYIEAEKLKFKIDSFMNDLWEVLPDAYYIKNGELSIREASDLGAYKALEIVSGYIDSLLREQSDADLEKEIDRVFFQQDCGSNKLYYKEIANIAHHFAEWGAIHLNTKEEE